MYYDQDGFGARFEWGEEGVRRMAGRADVVVVVDVLSFGTAVDIAVERGATVFPYRWRGEAAEAYAVELGAVLAVGRSHVDADHPYSLSPQTLQRIPPGTRLVLPSPNGAALAVAAAEAGAVVLAGCLRNAAATAEAARALGERVLVIAVGERWEGGSGPPRPAVEDLIGAGAILARLPSLAPSPEARAAIAAFREAAEDMPAFLGGCVSGRELAEDGFGQDVELAALLDISDAAPTLVAGAFTRAPERA